MEELARAKVNLFLRVVGKRADGYHLLDSLVVFAGAADVVRAEAADTLSLQVEGRFGAGLAGEADNLVLRGGSGLGCGGRREAGGGVDADEGVACGQRDWRRLG